jgi:hypothetical protein
MGWGATSVSWAALGVLAAALAGCEGGGATDSRCAGYLGCSAGQSVGIAPVPVVPPPKNTDVILRGAGCGKPRPADQPVTTPGQNTGWKPFTVMTTGATLAGLDPTKVGTRTFWVRLPADYDPRTAYRVVYIGGEYGSTEPTDVYPMFNEAMGGTEKAIYVALTVDSKQGDDDGYDEADGPASYEWEAFQLFQAVVDDTYCVDNNRIYAVGNDPGGFVANMWGCYFAGDGERPASDPTTPRAFARQYHLRGQGSVAAGDVPNDPPCNGPVAALWIHDTNDGDVPIALARAARDRVLTMNGCAGSPTADWHHEIAGLETCETYTACPPDYPVVFCQTTGLGHQWQASAAVPAWTLLFDQLTTRP